MCFRERVCECEREVPLPRPSYLQGPNQRQGARQEVAGGGRPEKAKRYISWSPHTHLTAHTSVVLLTATLCVCVCVCVTSPTQNVERETQPEIFPSSSTQHDVNGLPSPSLLLQPSLLLPIPLSLSPPLCHCLCLFSLSLHQARL